MELKVHSVERLYQFTSDNGVSTPQNHASLLRRAPNTNTWDFPDVIKFPLQCIRYLRKQSGSGIRTMIRIGLKS